MCAGWGFRAFSGAVDAAGAHVGTPAHTGLMLTVADLFAFENAHPKHTSLKEALIVDELGIKTARYYQLLLQAARSLEGWEMDPMLCHRVTLRALTRGARHLRVV